MKEAFRPLYCKRARCPLFKLFDGCGIERAIIEARGEKVIDPSIWGIREKLTHAASNRDSQSVYDMCVVADLNMLRQWAASYTSRLG